MKCETRKKVEAEKISTTCSIEKNSKSGGRQPDSNGIHPAPTNVVTEWTSASAARK